MAGSDVGAGGGSVGKSVLSIQKALGRTKYGQVLNGVFQDCELAVTMLRAIPLAACFIPL